MKQAFAFLAASLSLLAAPLLVQCQNAADPLRALLADAVKNSSLQSEGVPAFHMEARFETNDYLGEPLGSGNISADFLKPGYFRMTVHDGGTADQYAPEDQVAIGADAPPPGGNFIQRLVVEMFFHPGPAKPDLDNGKLKEKDQKMGTVTLRCVTLTPQKASSSRMASSDQVYCLSGEAPIFRMAQQRYGLNAVYNNMVRYGGHTFAKDVTIQQRGKVRAKLVVTKFVAAPLLKEADFPKPEQESPAQVGSRLAKIEGSVQAGKILKRATPVYPEDAKQNHVSGTVTLHAIIGKDGSIEDLEVISAPSESLAESAVDAVSQWKYSPYLLNGVATEVDTTITVHYSFG